MDRRTRPRQNREPSRPERNTDPVATRSAILALVDTDEPPLRLLLGDALLPSIQACYDERLETWHRWEPLSVAAQGTPRD